MIYKTLKKVNDVCQLLDKSKYPATKTEDGVTFTNNGDGTITVNSLGITATTHYMLCSPISLTKGHKYTAHIFGSYTDGYFYISVYNAAGNWVSEINQNIVKISEDGFTARPRIAAYINKPTGDKIYKPQLFDLTEMYGSGNEPATVEEFRSKFPNDLYDYSPRCFITSYKDCLKVNDYCQLLDKSKYPATTTKAGVTFTNNGDGSITVNGTATSIAFFLLFSYSDSLIPGHKYLLFGSPNDASANAYIQCYDMTNGEWLRDIGGGSIAIFPKKVVRPDQNTFIRIRIANSYTANNLTFKPQLFDLTEMYGVGHEPTTVEQFKADFPDELYDYKPYSIVPSYKKSLICKTKNLFDIPLTRGYPSDTSYENTTLRTFTVGTYIIGMTRNNQYEPYYITNVSVSKNNILFKTEQSGYGVSVPFLLTVGNTYTVSCKADNNYYPSIGISYYKENGTFISYTQFEVVTNNPVLSFTVPENTYYTLILFYGRTGNEYTFSNIQLELGSTATEYHPYGYL